ncbi:MAG: hypothetical protein RLN82_06885 [Pseudomonadales bacterium]
MFAILYPLGDIARRIVKTIRIDAILAHLCCGFVTPVTNATNADCHVRYQAITPLKFRTCFTTGRKFPFSLHRLIFIENMIDLSSILDEDEDLSGIFLVNVMAFGFYPNAKEPLKMQIGELD